MLRKTAFCLALLAVCATPAAAKQSKKDPVIPGHYTTKAFPGAEHENYLFFFSVFQHDKKPLKVKGKKYYLQTAAFFKWPKESALPADGVIHFCGEGVNFISPRGLPHTPGSVWEGEHDQPLYDIDVDTGHASNWPSTDPGPTVHFKWHGKFNLKKHRIKITGTCDGVTATRTYKLTKRF
jgi:hypothetical protein